MTHFASNSESIFQQFIGMIASKRRGMGEIQHPHAAHLPYLPEPRKWLWPFCMSVFWPTVYIMQSNASNIKWWKKSSILWWRGFWRPPTRRADRPVWWMQVAPRIDTDRIARCSATVRTARRVTRCRASATVDWAGSAHDATSLIVSIYIFIHSSGWLGNRVVLVSVPDSGAEGPGFKSQSRRCRVTVLGKLFTPIVPLFTKQRNW